MQKELTILMPCLNEALTIAVCIERAQQLLSEHAIDGEILVSDNGSTDGSQAIALALGARIVHCPVRGYGAALQLGIESADGGFILMGDSDDSYHFDEAYPMVCKLREGYDICMGTRLKGKIMSGAMPVLNRMVGNPVLTCIGQKLFRIPTTDFHCGMRAFRRDKVRAIGLITTGMEWASEMVIKSKLQGLSMTEVPVTLHKDGRNRPPHLRRWRDGWRHLRFMLVHAPNWIFVFPGLLLLAFGALGQILLIPRMIRIGEVRLDVHTMLICAFALIAGVQMIFTGLLANVYCQTMGILPVTARFVKAIRHLTLEKLLVLSVFCGATGLAGVATDVLNWGRGGFGPLNYEITMRHLIPSLSLMALALLGICNGFMLSILFMPTSKTATGLQCAVEIDDRPASLPEKRGKGTI